MQPALLVQTEIQSYSSMWGAGPTVGLTEGFNEGPTVVLTVVLFLCCMKKKSPSLQTDQLFL
jgi:hypothetical protein